MVHKVSPDDWALLVGRFITSFGDIEWAVNLLLKSWLSEEVAQQVIDGQQLAQRLVMIKALVPLHDFGGDQNRAVLLKQIEQITRLNGQRNLIAHNPIMISVFKREPNILSMEMRISGKKKNRHLTYPALQRESSEAAEVASRFVQNVIEIAQYKGQSDPLEA